MLTLYGEMFLSEYTLYDLNDELDCASTENVIEIQTTNPDYSGTDNLSLLRHPKYSAPGIKEVRVEKLSYYKRFQLRRKEWFVPKLYSQLGGLFEVRVLSQVSAHIRIFKYKTHESLNMIQTKQLFVNGMRVHLVFGMQFNLLHSTWSIITVISGRFSISSSVRIFHLFGFRLLKIYCIETSCKVSFLARFMIGILMLELIEV